LLVEVAVAAGVAAVEAVEAVEAAVVAQPVEASVVEAASCLAGAWAAEVVG